MRVTVVTNIPTPYRDFLFLRLQEALGFKNFSVFFLRHTEANRNFQTSSFGYSFSIFKGFYVYLLGFYHFHLVPSAWNVFALKNSQVVILGASWNDINIIIILLLLKLFLPKVHVSLWLEANYHSSRILPSPLGFIRYFIRKTVVSSADSYIVPNNFSKQTLSSWCSCAHKPFLILPNLVNSPFQGFRRTVKYSAFTGTGQLHFLILARLYEFDKGIVNFIQSICHSRFFENATISIAGDGPDAAKIKQFSSRYSNIKLLGHVNETKKWHLLADADVFALPSFRDPCPVSVVEAASASLPLLVSNRCGNSSQLCSPGVNGYLFDPNNRDSLMEAFENMFINMSLLADFGYASRRLYEKTHAPEAVTANFCKHFDSLVS